MDAALCTHAHSHTHTYVPRAVTISALLARTMSARFSFEIESAAGCLCVTKSEREAELGERALKRARSRESVSNARCVRVECVGFLLLLLLSLEATSRRLTGHAVVG